MPEWVTSPLGAGQWPGVVAAVVAFLIERQVEAAELLHGWSLSGFDGSPEGEARQWQPEPVQVAGLSLLLRERERLGFCLGRDDLFLTLPGGPEVKFCHEGDLHLRADDSETALLLQARLSELGVSLRPLPSCSAEPSR